MPFGSISICTSQSTGAHGTGPSRGFWQDFWFKIRRACVLVRTYNKNKTWYDSTASLRELDDRFKHVYWKHVCQMQVPHGVVEGHVSLVLSFHSHFRTGPHWATWQRFRFRGLMLKDNLGLRFRVDGKWSGREGIWRAGGRRTLYIYNHTYIPLLYLYICYQSYLVVIYKYMS